MTAAIFKIPDSAVSDNYGKRSQTWNKFSKIPNLPTLNDEIRKEKSGKNWEGNSTLNANSSTLSLYITAYENSSEAVTFDSFHDNENSLTNNKFGSIKRHEILDTSTFFIQNPFEFSRQQNYEAPEPKMCQYKASQRLLNPTSMIAQQAGTVTEIWMFFWLLIFVVSTGVIISITCNKGRQPPTSKKHQRQKNSNAESIKSKKYNVKNGKKGGENSKNNNVEKSRNTGSSKRQQPPSENVFQSSSQGDKRESEAEMDFQQQKSEQASKKYQSNQQATDKTPYENWNPPDQGPQAENKGDEVEQKSEEKIPPDDAPQKNDNETDKASTKEPKKKKKKKQKKKKAAKDSDEEEDEASTKKEKKKKHKKKKKKKEKDNEDKDEEDEKQSGKKKKSKKHKKKKVKKETDDEGEDEGGGSETEIEPQKPAEPQIPTEPQIPPQPQIPTEPQKPAEEIPALSLKLTKTKYENVGILQNPKKGKKHNPGLMTRYNNLLISGDEAEEGKELPSQLKRFVKPPLQKIEDQPLPLPSPPPVKMLSPAERMPRSLQLDKTQDQSKIITGIENEIVTALPCPETQKAEKMPKKNKLDKTQDHRYNKENSPPMSLSTTQELPPVKATLQKTQTYFDVTQQDGGSSATTQKSLSKLTTAIEDEVFATGLQRTETQESESTQTLAKVASLTPIETTQCSTLGETQLTTKATQQTQTAAPPSHKSVTEEPLKTATERDQLDKIGENQNNPPILLSTKQTKKDASVKIKKVDEAEKKKLNVEAEREAKKAAEGERLRKLRENTPKPKVLKRNSWEEKVAEGKVFRRKHEYPTMNDVVSDWESEESSENPRKDQPPGTPK